MKGCQSGAIGSYVMGVMQCPTLLPDPELVSLDSLVSEAQCLVVVVSARRPAATCPRCQEPAERVHSRYHRTLADQPWNAVRVRLELRTRRWFCDRPDCPQHIFTERFPGLVERYARRTDDQARVLRLIGYVLGGEAGARTAGELGMPVSPDTLLRQLRRRGKYTGPAPRVLGVDDFALARGQRYGTILVDLERGEPIELLSDRTADTFAAWLREHPGAEVISRDRSGSYADGARRGAPQAVQVADRFHLLQNLTEALGEVLAREQPALREAASARAETEADPGSASAVDKVPEGGPPAVEAADERTTAIAAGPAEEQVWDRRSRREREHSALSRERRLQLYEESLHLAQQGLHPREIARRLGISRTTVRKYLAEGAFPERKERATPPGPLAPYAGYLRQRWQEGCHDVHQLWRELRERGYTGQPVSVWRFTRPWAEARRRQPSIPPRDPSVPASPAPRSVVWWLLCPKKRTEAQTTFASRLLESSTTVRLALELTEQFFALARERRADKLEAWIGRVQQSGLQDLVGFANGLRRDWDAVVAGLSLPWSNGQTEGQVNRLKLVKRQMYGRAGIALLRGRVLPSSAPG